MCGHWCRQFEQPARKDQLENQKMRSFVLPIFDGVIMDGHPIF